MATDYTFGIEEEFFVVDRITMNSTRSLPPTFLAEARDRLGERVSLELLQSQIETQTEPHTKAGDALEELVELRSGVLATAERFNLGIAASGTHPFAIWHGQRHTERARYRMLMNDLRMLATRNLVCGLHVHVGVPDERKRVALMTRTIPYLPLFLALSSSSPFWQGHATGLVAYRPSAYDELPRTGLPPAFADDEAYQAYVQALVASGAIPDESYIWWAIRPSMAHPTLELRIADSVTRVEDAVAIAMLFRALVHRLDRDPDYGVAVDTVVRTIAEENRWRVQREGLDARIVDVRTRRGTMVRHAIRRLMRDLAPDAAMLGRADDLEGVKRILDFGTSATGQLAVFATARAGDHTREEALKGVVRWLLRETAERPQGRTRPRPGATDEARPAV